MSQIISNGLGAVRSVVLGWIVLASIAESAQAQSDYFYSTNKGGARIHGYRGPGGEVVVPDTIQGFPVISIEDAGFGGVTNVTAVALPDSLVHIGALAFRSCSGLARITIPGGVRHIEPGTFAQCSSLVDLTIGDGVETIGIGAFEDCVSLPQVTIPGSVVNLHPWAFVRCSRLTAITVDESNTVYSSVDGVLFDKARSILLHCPAGKEGGYSVPDGARLLEGWSLSFCSLLTSITLPDSVVNIGDGAFVGCALMNSIDLGRGVTNIGSSAFSACSNLTAIQIPASVVGIGQETFAICPALTAIEVDPANPVYRSVDGVLFDAALSVLVKFPEARTGNYTIPDSVTHVARYAFVHCHGVEHVTVGPNVIQLGVGAFAFATNLVAVYFTGNAPVLEWVGAVPFLESNLSTVYYFPGTTGWGDTFAGRPAFLWNPRILAGGDGIGVRNGRFGFAITGAHNLVVVVETRGDAGAGPWMAVGTNRLTNGMSYFQDFDWTNHPRRVYRLRSP